MILETSSGRPQAEGSQLVGGDFVYPGGPVNLSPTAEADTRTGGPENR